MHDGYKEGSANLLIGQHNVLCLWLTPLCMYGAYTCASRDRFLIAWKIITGKCNQQDTSLAQDLQLLMIASC